LKGMPTRKKRIQRSRMKVFRKANCRRYWERRCKQMVPQFNVFRVEENGLRWVESASSLATATARVRELAAHSLGEYLVVDQRTGEKYAIAADGVADPPASWHNEGPRP